MGKRKKKKKSKAYRKKQAFYNQLFSEKTTKPEDIRQIALQVFGSTYFSPQKELEE
jgi:hypothetical protein